MLPSAPRFYEAVYLLDGGGVRSVTAGRGLQSHGGRGAQTGGGRLAPGTPGDWETDRGLGDRTGTGRGIGHWEAVRPGWERSVPERSSSYRDQLSVQSPLTRRSILFLLPGVCPQPPPPPDPRHVCYPSLCVSPVYRDGVLCVCPQIGAYLIIHHYPVFTCIRSMVYICICLLITTHGSL